MAPSDIATQDPQGSIATLAPGEDAALRGEQTLLPERANEHATAVLDETLASNQVGRFALLRRIGKGAMGAIYAAYDDVLDRKIAIKLVLPHIAASERARDRMLREAQALARLRHTNVVQVYDAGVEGDRLFIAMEFVQGMTLRQWKCERDEARPWREVLDVYAQAGRGLAAAHAAGLVHRDFKPDNAMLGSDGVVRVMDFGLARADSGQPPELETREHGDDLGSTHVDRSARAGTPAYMAPEQWGGGAVDARADQFSFCVALFEALWGRRPFEADSLPALAAAVIEGRRTEEPSNDGVPERIRRAVVRGLCPEPDERWPSMDALLAELTDPGTRDRRTGWLAGGLGLALVTTVASLAVGSSSADPCAGVDQTVNELWSPEQRQAVRSGITSIDTGYSADTAARLDLLLHDYARALIDGRTDACEASMVRREQSEDIMLLRMRCLDRRQHAFAAQLEVLEHPDAQILERAVELARGLPSVDPCGELDYVSADVPPPDDPQVAAEVEQIREQLARVDALASAGKYSDAQPLADQLLARAEASGYGPVSIEALNALAVIQNGLGDNEAALRLARDAYVRLGDVSAFTVLETHLLLGEAYLDLGRHEDARTEFQRALALDRRQGTGPRQSTARIHNNVARLFSHQGRAEDALPEYERALEIWRELYGERDGGVATAYNNMGTSYLELGRYEEGLALLYDSLAIRVDVLGPDHPRVGVNYSNIAAALQSIGRTEDAAASYREAISILRAAHGDQHPQVGRVRDNLGTALRDLGRLDEALAEHELARQIMLRNPSTKSHYVVENRLFTGVVLRRMNRLDAALLHYEEGLELAREIFEPDNPTIAVLRDNIGVIYRVQGQYARSLREHRAAQAIKSRALGPSHPRMTRSHVNIGKALYELGRYEEALVEAGHARAQLRSRGEAGRLLLGVTDELSARIHLALGQTEQAIERAEQALESHAGSKRDVSPLASARFTLARALWTAGVDRRRAHGLATQAAEVLRGLDAPPVEELAAVEQWLDAHPSGSM